MPLRSNQPRRNKRRVCVFAGCLVFLLGAIQGFSRELRTAAEIRQLSFEETQRHAPVHLRGVLTFYDQRLYSYFVQDSTAGIYLQFPANSGPPDLAPGQLVDVAGFCSPGEYAPVVVVSNITALGTGPLPEPKSVTYEQLASGVEDSQYIELTGIVRSVRPAEDVPYQLLDIAAGGGRLLVYAKDVPVKPIDRLCDSTVHIRGVCSTKFNHKRQLFAIRIMVPRAADLEITSPAPKDPFAIAARSIGSLLQFAPREQFGHRVKVVGTVIYQRPGQTIFLEDGEQGVEVQTEERKPLHLGDRVEVLGFVGQGDYTPLLQNATYRKIGSTNVPAPA